MMRPFIFAIAMLLPPSAMAEDMSPQPLSNAAKDALDAGQPFVKVWQDDTREDGAMDVIGIIDIAAPPNLIWNVMTDCARAKDIVADMKSCKVLERAPDGSWDIREQKVKVNVLISSASVFRSDYTPYKTIEISRAGGDMKVQDGQWTLTPLSKTPLGGQNTRVTYRAASAPKFPVPKSSLKKAMANDVPKILMNLRQAAEGDLKVLAVD